MTLFLQGYWTARYARPLSGEIEQLGARLGGARGTAVVDLSRLEQLDTAGAWMIREVQAECRAAGLETEIAGMDSRVSDLMEAIPETLPEPEKATSKPGRNLFELVLDPMGKSAAAAGRDVYRGVGYFGALFLGLKALFPGAAASTWLQLPPSLIIWACARCRSSR
nr:STAS domain-containing protein [Marinicella sp. W31]MDC2876703.1 STAS domain-containing protein [Marinicella sp. W31]